MFISAKPIWLDGSERQQNTFVAFKTTLSGLHNFKISIAAATFYRLYINDRFVAFGPARTAKGYARVDIIDLPIIEEESTILIEVAGYYCRSLSTVRQPSFLIAEVFSGDEILAYTGRDFLCREMREKERFSERYSQQRHFGEIWDDTKPQNNWVEPAIMEDSPVFLKRSAPYPAYQDVALNQADVGTFQFDPSLPCVKNRYSFKGSEFWGAFAEEEIPYKPYRWVQVQKLSVKDHARNLPLTLSAGEYLLFDFNRIECGFLKLALESSLESDIVVAYTEYCEADTFSFTQMNAQNVVEFILNEGFSGEKMTFEPYTLRKAILFVKSGKITLRQFGIKSFTHPLENVYRPDIQDAMLQKIYDAAIRTFTHNAVDIYMDCPSRERAGWLCDSYFTGIVEHFLFNESKVEEDFLENYRLYSGDAFVPKGMLPDRYPSDNGHGGYGDCIPQWCMWYILEVRDFLLERKPDYDKELFRESVEGILNYLKDFENEDGLLESLPGWNFVEWSDANNWVEFVNYPTNFLYAEALSCGHALYGNEEWLEKSKKIRRIATEKSFDGKLFVDEAVRENGLLVNNNNTSEACQYYALLFGGIDLDQPCYSFLKEQLLNNFSAMEQEDRPFVPVNAFIGLYLRLMALLKLKYYDLLLEDVKGFFGGMVEKTKTLWEYRQQKGSYDHGFASFAAVAIWRAINRL
ncbi:MAG: hypothetical protein IJN80_07360 [Clostridia bacterium]|nr:hypothetical protein [Clostridia bacterium]